MASVEAAAAAALAVGVVQAGGLAVVLMVAGQHMTPLHLLHVSRLEPRPSH